MNTAANAVWDGAHRRIRMQEVGPHDGLQRLGKGASARVDRPCHRAHLLKLSCDHNKDLACPNPSSHSRSATRPASAPS